ncbi:MAG: organomercurial lyase [Rhodothermales bacterium]
MAINTLADSDRIAQALDAFPDTFLNLSRDEQRVSLAIYHLLATGESVLPEAIAAEVGVAEERVGELLDRWNGVYLDAEGRVVGYWGLTPSEMNHRLEVAGRTVYAWCAWDALFIPPLLGQTVEVTSKSPVTGEVIHLIVSAEGARSADGTDVYVSFLEPDEEKLAEDVIGSFCHYVFFFASLEEGEQWTAAHPGTYLLTLDQAFGLGQRKNRRQYPDALTETGEGKKHNAHLV